MRSLVRKRDQHPEVASVNLPSDHLMISVGACAICGALTKFQLRWGEADTEIDGHDQHQLYHIERGESIGDSAADPAGDPREEGPEPG